MSNNGKSDFKGRLRKSILDPTLYLDNLSIVGNVDTLANCIYRELIENKQPKSEYMSVAELQKHRAFEDGYMPELCGYKAFKDEVKRIIIKYLRKKGIEDSLIKDSNKEFIEKVKNEFMNEIRYYNKGIIFYDMEKTEVKPKQCRFKCYIYRIDEDKNLIKAVHTIMWELDREGLPKSYELKYQWGRTDYLVETIVEKLETVVNQQGVAISGKHIIEYIECAERQLLDEDTLRWYYEFNHDDTHLGEYSWGKHPKFVGDYIVSKDNPHLIDAKVCYSFNTVGKQFKASEVNGKLQRTRKKLDYIPFLDGSSIIKNVICYQKIIDNCIFDPILSVISSKIYNILERAYDFIIQRFQVKIDDMCKTEIDLANNTLLEIQSSEETSKDS